MLAQKILKECSAYEGDNRLVVIGNQHEKSFLKTELLIIWNKEKIKDSLSQLVAVELLDGENKIMCDVVFRRRIPFVELVLELFQICQSFISSGSIEIHIWDSEIVWHFQQNWTCFPEDRPPPLMRTMMRLQRSNQQQLYNRVKKAGSKKVLQFHRNLLIFLFDRDKRAQLAPHLHELSRWS